MSPSATAPSSALGVGDSSGGTSKSGAKAARLLGMLKNNLNFGFGFLGAEPPLRVAGLGEQCGVCRESIGSGGGGFGHICDLRRGNVALGVEMEPWDKFVGGDGQNGTEEKLISSSGRLRSHLSSIIWAPWTWVGGTGLGGSSSFAMSSSTFADGAMNMWALKIPALMLSSVGPIVVALLGGGVSCGVRSVLEVLGVAEGANAGECKGNEMDS
ncbi:hypothetical protein CRG98_015117 [Punica granatum]|uniref:Uncharacterized protein n=1 Tax=Punica granatum TaxID=22663 RepID=A0A2I0K7F3_PUNGR|nr:hypothetical protein CRG98_015117 [Punica granatum]